MCFLYSLNLVFIFHHIHAPCLYRLFCTVINETTTVEFEYLSLRALCVFESFKFRVVSFLIF